jgi:hypothetical protein
MGSHKQPAMASSIEGIMGATEKTTMMDKIGLYGKRTFREWLLMFGDDEEEIALELGTEPGLVKKWMNLKMPICPDGQSVFLPSTEEMRTLAEGMVVKATGGPDKRLFRKVESDIRKALARTVDSLVGPRYLSWGSSSEEVKEWLEKNPERQRVSVRERGGKRARWDSSRCCWVHPS